MYRLDIERLRGPAADAGIRISLHAAEIIRLMVELKSNGEILEYLHLHYGTEWRGSAQKRKFAALLQGFIIANHYEAFSNFCRKNGISIFNEDLEVMKGDNTYARIVFVVFLREEIGLKPPITILA